MQKAVQRQRMGILLCEQNFRDFWIRNKSVRAEIGQILHTHTHTTAAKLVVRISILHHDKIIIILTWCCKIWIFCHSRMTWSKSTPGQWCKTSIFSVVCVAEDCSVCIAGDATIAFFRCRCRRIPSTLCRTASRSARRCTTCRCAPRPPLTYRCARRSRRGRSRRARCPSRRAAYSTCRCAACSRFPSAPPPTLYLTWSPRIPSCLRPHTSPRSRSPTGGSTGIWPRPPDLTFQRLPSSHGWVVYVTHRRDLAVRHELAYLYLYYIVRVGRGKQVESRKIWSFEFNPRGDHWAEFGPRDQCRLCAGRNSAQLGMTL